MSGGQPIFDANDKDFFSDANFASFDNVENETLVDGEGHEIRPVTTAQFADWAPGPNEGDVQTRARPVGDTSTLTFGDDVL